MNDQAGTTSGMGSKIAKGCGLVVAGIVGLGVLGAIVGDGKDDTATATKVVTPNEVIAGSTVAAPPAEPQASSLTGPQANAARSATQYLNMSGFSRKGLIAQLSSDAGDGYAVSDATAAVDSLDVDWNEQAARSAKSYLEMSGFSCKGLIDQLSSSAGDKYTESQAEHGAKAAGAC